MNPIIQSLHQILKCYNGILKETFKDSPLQRHYYPFYLICQHNGKINQQDLAVSLQLNKVAITRIIRYLTKLRLVTKKVDPSDKRCFILSLSGEGEKFKNLIDGVFRKTEKICLDGMDPDEKKRLEINLSGIENRLKKSALSKSSIQ